MTRLIFFHSVVLLIAMAGFDSFGQQFPSDSTKNVHVANNYDSLLTTSKLARHADSLRIITWGDSMRMKVRGHFNKTRKTLSHEPDSLEKITLKASDYKRKTDGLLKAADPSSKVYQVLKARQDSLKKIKLPGTKYTKNIEKAAEKEQKMIAEVNKKQKDLQQTVTGRYTKWEGSVRSKLKLDSFRVKGTSKLPGMKQLNTNGAAGKLPNIKTPGLNRGIPSGLPKMPGLNTGDFSKLGLSKELSGIGGNLSIPQMSQLGQWEKNIPGMSSIPIKEVTQTISSAKGIINNPSQSAENAVTHLGDVKALNKEITAGEKLVSSNEALQTAEKMKSMEAMKAEAKKQAINHFAGKEEILKKSMNDMAKYKKKYHSINSLSEIKKLKWWQPINRMKGKPFRERFHPGLNLGYSTRKDTFNLDLFPNVSYQVSSRFEFGLGARYRLHINTKNVSFDQSNPVWGLTGFSTFKLFKSTLFRLETDAVNSPLPLKTNDATLERSWRWQLLIGIQNNFEISKTIKGNIQMLYNFDKKLKDAFPEMLMLRLGMQVQLKRQLPKIPKAVH